MNPPYKTKNKSWRKTTGSLDCIIDQHARSAAIKYK